MTAKRTLWDIGVSVGVGRETVSVGAGVAEDVDVGRRAVGDGASLGVSEGNAVAVGVGGGGLRLQAANRTTQIRRMIDQTTLGENFAAGCQPLAFFNRLRPYRNFDFVSQSEMMKEEK
jgi:hypothetical protein